MWDGWETHMIGGGNTGRRTLVERLYALLAYASAMTIFGAGGYALSRIARDEIMVAPWQVILACMLVPLLAAATVSCGNYHENRAVRAATWIVIAPLGAINPLFWLGALIILARPHVRPGHRHAAGTNYPSTVLRP